MLDVFTLSLDAPDRGMARLTLTGHLDDTGARELLHAAASVVRSGCSTLVLDVDGLTGADDQATYALTGCSRLSRYLTGGVAVVAETAAGAALAGRAGIDAAGAALARAGHARTARAARTTGSQSARDSPQPTPVPAQPRAGAER